MTSKDIKDYLFVSHRSQEVGHIAMMELLGMRPILDLEMRLGEGTGSVLAMNLIEASAKVLMEIKTLCRGRRYRYRSLRSAFPALLTCGEKVG